MQLKIWWALKSLRNTIKTFLNLCGSAPAKCKGNKGTNWKFHWICKGAGLPSRSPSHKLLDLVSSCVNFQVMLHCMYYMFCYKQTNKSHGQRSVLNSGLNWFLHYLTTQSLLYVNIVASFCKEISPCSYSLLGGERTQHMENLCFRWFHLSFQYFCHWSLITTREEGRADEDPMTTDEEI